MKRFFHLLFLVLINPILHAQQPDIPINPNFTWNGENSLGVNPINTQNLVIAWMKATTFTQVTIAISRSNDGGNSWSDPVYMPHYSSGYTSADPTIIFSNEGTVYLAYIDYNKTTIDAGAVYVCNSNDGGATWSQPVESVNINETPDKAIDRPWIVIDNSGGTFNHRLYIVTKGIKQAPFPHHLYLVSSSDAGITWNNPKRIDDAIMVGSQSNSMGVPAVSINGTLHVAYLSYDPASSLYVRDILISSTDGGNNFTPHVIDTIPLASVIPPGDSLYQYSYFLGTNPVSAGNLIYIYTDHRNGDMDILATSSSDEGFTWNAIQRLNDDPVGNRIGQDMCWGGFSPNGKFAALWRDRRDGTPSPSSDYRIYGAYSIDGGSTFSTNFALSATMGALAIPIDGNDFLGVGVSDSIINGTWADKRGISDQIFYNRHSIPSFSSIRNLADNSEKRLIQPVVTIDCSPLFPNIISLSSHNQLTIVNPLGKTVKTLLNPRQVCFEELPDGIYFLILNTGTIVIVQRIILLR